MNISKSRQTLNRLAEDIAKLWKPGTQIPTEPELCARYGVSRVTLREAVSALAQEGVLYRHQGRGTFVLDAESFRRNEKGPKIVFFPGNAERAGFSDPMVSRYISGAFLEASKLGAELELHDFSRLEEMERYLLRDLADAAILLSPHPSRLESIQRTIERVVVINGGSAATGVVSIRHNARHGSHLALKHLVSTGAQNIFFVHRTGIAGLGERLEGLRESYFRMGLPWDESRVWSVTIEAESDPVTAAIFAAKKTVLSALASGLVPDAIFALSDRLAIGSLRALRESEAAFAKNVRVMGYDGIAWGEDVNPSLSTVLVPAEEMGALAVRKALQSSESGLSDDLILEPELLLRRSA